MKSRQIKGGIEKKIEKQKGEVRQEMRMWDVQMGKNTGSDGVS